MTADPQDGVTCACQVPTADTTAYRCPFCDGCYVCTHTLATAPPLPPIWRCPDGRYVMTPGRAGARPVRVRRRKGRWLLPRL